MRGAQAWPPLLVGVGLRRNSVPHGCEEAGSVEEATGSEDALNLPCGDSRRPWPEFVGDQVGLRACFGLLAALCGCG
jgi:hypothetical protein